MKYTVARLRGDVMARLGEPAQPRDVESSSGVPWPEEVVAIRVGSLLGEVGSSLIKEAPVEALVGGCVLPCSGKQTMRKMPCSLYSAEVRLPAGFLRLGSVKMAEWRRSVSAVVLPGSVEWSRQWSAEKGMAGCPESPRTYLDSDMNGVFLRLVGSLSAGDALEWMCVWCVPEPSSAGEFYFPETLYPALVGRMVSRCGGSGASCES